MPGRAGVACTPSLVAILLLSTMKGSSNWYCISRSSRRVGLIRPRTRSTSAGMRGAWSTGVAGVLVDDVDELAGGAGVGVVGEVPHLARGVGVFAEDGEAFADVGDVGVGVRLVGVAEHGGGLAGQGGGEDAVAEVGLGAAAGTEVVRGAADRDLDAAGLVGGEQLAGHPAAQLALLGVGGVGAVLGERLAGGRPYM